MRCMSALLVIRPLEHHAIKKIPHCALFPDIGSYLTCFLLAPVCPAQPVCLATFSQVRSISCVAESDGRALLTVHIEGAKQVNVNFKKEKKI